MTPIFSILLCNLCVALLPANTPGAASQTPKARGKNAAVFNGGTVLWDDFYLELARRHRGRPLGKESLDHLIDKKIVEIEAANRGSSVSAAEIQARYDDLEARLERSKITLSEHLKAKRMSDQDFRAYLKLSLQNEKLVRTDLGLDDGSPLLPEQIRLWAVEKRRQHKVIRDISKLAFDVCATIGEERISLRSLGEVMAPGISRSDRENLLEQMVAHRLLAMEAKRLKLETTDAMLDEEIVKRSKSLAANAKFKGISLKQLLAAQGRTIEDFRRGEVLRTQVLVLLLGEHLHPETSLVAELEKKPGYWLDRVGPSRHVYRLYLRKSKKRSFERVREALNDLRSKIKSLEIFKQATTRFSDDMSSKKSGGSMGFLHRKEDAVSAVLLKAAFSLPLAKVSEAIHEDKGSSLLWVSEIKAAPKGDEIYVAMRQFKMNALLVRLVRESGLRFIQH